MPTAGSVWRKGGRKPWRNTWEGWSIRGDALDDLGSPKMVNFPIYHQFMANFTGEIQVNHQSWECIPYINVYNLFADKLIRMVGVWFSFNFCLGKLKHCGCLTLFSQFQHVSTILCYLSTIHPIFFVAVSSPSLSGEHQHLWMHGSSQRVFWTADGYWDFPSQTCTHQSPAAQSIKVTCAQEKMSGVWFYHWKLAKTRKETDVQAFGCDVCGFFKENMGHNTLEKNGKTRLPFFTLVSPR